MTLHGIALEMGHTHTPPEWARLWAMANCARRAVA
jgi:hypothetical protein